MPSGRTPTIRSNVGKVSSVMLVIIRCWSARRSGCGNGRLRDVKDTYGVVFTVKSKTPVLGATEDTKLLLGLLGSEPKNVYAPL
jgi:hypothetical protein